MQWWTSWRHRNEAQPDPAGATDLLLSAYLDGDFVLAERATLERRLADDPGLRDALEDMREVVLGLQGMEDIRAPRVFTIAADAPVAPRGLSRLELGVRAGAVAAAAAFVFAVGIDVLSDSAGGVRGQAAPLRAAVESASSNSSGFAAADAPSTTSPAGAGMSEAAPALGGGSAAATAEDAAVEPSAIPTSFAVRPAPPALTSTTTPSSQRQQTQPDTAPAMAPAATPVPTRTPPVAATSAATTTSALQGAAAPSAAITQTATPPAGPPGTGAAAAPAVAPAETPVPGSTPTPAAPAAVTRTPPVKPGLTAVAPGPGGGSSGSLSGSSGAAPVAPRPALPTVTSTPPPTVVPLTPAPAEQSASAPAIAPATPSTGGQGETTGAAPSRGAIEPLAPEAEGGAWGADTLRVSVAREEGVDGLRVTQAGLGALALGLGGLTAWMWYARRREAITGGV